jgi:hypothetical protein
MPNPHAQNTVEAPESARLGNLHAANHTWHSVSGSAYSAFSADFGWQAG